MRQNRECLRLMHVMSARDCVELCAFSQSRKSPRLLPAMNVLTARARAQCERHDSSSRPELRCRRGWRDREGRRYPTPGSRNGSGRTAASGRCGLRTSTSWRHRTASRTFVLPGLEGGRPRRGDGDALPRSRIAVRALAPAPRGERSVACDGDGLALSEGVGDGGEHGVDRVAAAAVVDSEVRSATRDVSCGFLIGLLVALRPIGRTAIG